MNAALELHDTEVVSYENRDGQCGSLLLDAYVHRTAGVPGIDAGEGGTQRVRVYLMEPRLTGALGSLPTYIFEGSVMTGNERFENMLPLPFSYEGQFSLSLTLTKDARIVTFAASGVSIATEGPFKFVEFFEGASA